MEVKEIGRYQMALIALRLRFATLKVRPSSPVWPFPVCQNYISLALTVCLSMWGLRSSLCVHDCGSAGPRRVTADTTVMRDGMRSRPPISSSGAMQVHHR